MLTFRPLLLTLVGFLYLTCHGFSGSASAADMTLNLGTVSGAPGAVVAVPITFSNGAGTGATGIEMNVSFDPTIVGAPTASPSPQVKSQVPSSDSFFIVFISPDLSPLPDGVLATISFTISPAALPGTSTPLTASLLVTDANGVEIPVSGKSGQINVITKPGDCDFNGSVTIPEVQSSINMFLGVTSSTPCVDLDGSGGASISELQKTINAFLGF